MIDQLGSVLDSRRPDIPHNYSSARCDLDVIIAMNYYSSRLSSARSLEAGSESVFWATTLVFTDGSEYLCGTSPRLRRCEMCHVHRIAIALWPRSPPNTRLSTNHYSQHMPLNNEIIIQIQQSHYPAAMAHINTFDFAFLRPRQRAAGAAIRRFPA